MVCRMLTAALPAVAVGDGERRPVGVRVGEAVRVGLVAALVAVANGAPPRVVQNPKDCGSAADTASFQSRPSAVTV